MSNRMPSPDRSRIAGFDPQIQPVLPSEPLPLLPPDCLCLDAIRQAFRQPVDWQVEPLFAQAFVPGGDSYARARQAAVLMPLVQRKTGLNVLFTRRADHLHHHAGQISFPGGRIESTDSGPVAAAIRETHEEIGVEQRFVQVIGMQPTLLTTTQFLMTPVVGELLPGFRLRPDEAEVAEVFEVPLAVLMDPGLHVLHRMETSLGHGRCYFAIRWQSHFIWGATAILIRNFYHFLAAARGIRTPDAGDGVRVVP
ncbi:CoA pyrophosphatase [Castellaniella denitrificans]|uniref:CoA pyrophosphatase n=1 Tax=Castellaniella denitrificans TaxID=56119 RepID=A0ABT4M4W7_9BURK|nr:CoA pyrophosphatase [Castellaniella denitrificans]MCZ4330050.1 CoA pyrophosphatase [Castellaniella denitrificans]